MAEQRVAEQRVAEQRVAAKLLGLAQLLPMVAVGRFTSLAVWLRLVAASRRRLVVVVVILLRPRPRPLRQLT